MYRVVLIDDEPIIFESLKRMVPWSDYSCEVVAVAKNAAEGRAMIFEHRPHIVFTDIHLPDQDGLTLMAGLRSQYPDMQIIVLSGYSDFHYAQQAICLGVCRFILKPSKMHELKEAIVEAVSRLKGHGATEPPSECSAGGFIVEQARAYIQEHYAEKLELNTIAQICYVSQWHLSKLLNNQLGQSFYTLLNSIRIKEAKKLLADPSLKIKKICEMVGYTDVTHFSRVFKSMEGMSAGQYRNQMGMHTS